jgi:hypothetical protein
MKKPALSGKKRFLFYVIYYPSIVLLIFSLAEAAARVMGFRPWAKTKTDIVVEPGGRFFRSHPTLGYTPLPGTFKVTLSGSYFFNATNLDNTHRVTHPLNTYPGRAKKSIWIFGDSITYGQSVDDAQTYCWLLQERLPEYEIVNFGVMGYGTVQSLIQLRDALNNTDKPELIVLTYASWQDVRNTSIRGWQKMRQPAASLGPVTQAYARLDSAGQLEILTDTLPFREVPLMRYSAFIHALEESYDRYEERHSQSHEITKAIIKEISDLCKARRIELVVAGLTSDSTTADTLEYCKREGLKTVNIWVDFLNIKENNNLPYDSHPSAIAHKQYADKLEAFLRRDVLKAPLGN